MYDEYDGDEGSSSLGRKIALGIGVVAIAAAGFFAFNAVTGGDDDGDAVGGDGTAASTVAPDDTSVTTTSEAARTIATETTADSPATTSTTAAAATSETTAPPTTVEATTAPTPAPTTAVPATYPTRPDGSPEWIVLIYDETSITLKGVVPDEASKEKLENIALQFARDDTQRAAFNNQLSINPAMPMSVGVRVVELTSTRFPEGSAEIAPSHALEFDRVVAAMTVFPNITALIIGHADQRGDEVANYVLSKERADAVLLYIASKGIDPARLEASAVGEEDLLSLNDNDAALALNRRTEFVVFGLLLT